VNVLVDQNQYGSIIFVLLSVLYSFLLVYQVLKYKGMKILHRMQGPSASASDSSPGGGSDLEEMIRVVANSMYRAPVVDTVGNALHNFSDGDTSISHPTSATAAASSHRLSIQLMQRKALCRFWVCVVTFLLAFAAVNI